MKSLFVGLILILSLSLSTFAGATGPEYFSSRDWIKEKAHSSSPSQGIVYLGEIETQFGILIPYRKTLKIENLVALTSYKGRLAGITVMRAQNRIEPVFRGVCKPGSTVDFMLRPDDVVWVFDPDAGEL